MLRWVVVLGGSVCIPLVLLITVGGALMAAGPGSEAPPGAQEAPTQIQSFGALVVGTWDGEGSRHVHEWGVGRRLIRSHSYFEQDGAWVLVSEGIWYWDDAEQVIRGTHLAIEMPVDRFDYRSRVEGRTVVHALRAFGAQPGTFTETWSFEGDGYTWALERPGEDGPERVMGGSYRRSAGSGSPAG